MAAPAREEKEKEKEKREDGGKGEGGRMESLGLGWLTESAVMPKKHKAIEGVGAASIVELKAQLYRTQEEARKAKDSDPSSSSAASAADASRARKRSADLFSPKNSGVDARAHKDKLEMKAIRDGSVSYAALEKKAALYEKLSRGELSDEEEKEKYCVDFFQKSMEHDGSPPSDSQHNDNANGADLPLRDGDRDGDDVNDAFLSSRPFGLGRAASAVDRDEHKRFVREVHEEVNQAREKTSTLKMRRQEQEVARREKLRQAYLKKQLDKLLSSKQTATTDSSSAG
ncbi:Coiled-coil domain-containing protein 174 [Rhynchospora pubera]|uniref:Coiled-coil domain-containing protein 174 n=1 Tax=Rhynchospora pubera TaxID=906938 RepID=A0AAV8DR33_9POAL|nr:Coiled-coil domain-containing protein 174 [Rhynchospora pubera]